MNHLSSTAGLRYRHFRGASFCSLLASPREMQDVLDLDGLPWEQCRLGRSLACCVSLPLLGVVPRSPRSRGKASGEKRGAPSSAGFLAVPLSHHKRIRHRRASSQGPVSHPCGFCCLLCYSEAAVGARGHCLPLHACAALRNSSGLGSAAEPQVQDPLRSADLESSLQEARAVESGGF